MKPAGATDKTLQNKLTFPKMGIQRSRVRRYPPGKCSKPQSGSRQLPHLMGIWLGWHQTDLQHNFYLACSPQAISCLPFSADKNCPLAGEHSLQLLEWEEMGSLCSPPLPGHLPVRRLRLFFSLSVLWPGGSQNSGCFCL